MLLSPHGGIHNMAISSVFLSITFQRGSLWGKKINKSVNLMCFLRHNHFRELCPGGCISRRVHGNSMADSNGFVGVQLLRAGLGACLFRHKSNRKRRERLNFGTAP